MRSRMFVLFSAHPPAVKTQVADEITALLKAAGDPTAHPAHFSNGVSVVIGEFSDELGSQIMSKYPQVRTIQTNHTIHLQSQRTRQATV